MGGGRASCESSLLSQHSWIIIVAVGADCGNRKGQSRADSGEVDDTDEQRNT